MKDCENPECKNRFRPQSVRHRFCCEKCNSRAKYLEKKSGYEVLECQRCGNEFKVTRAGQKKCGPCRKKISDRDRERKYRDHPEIDPTVKLRNRFLLANPASLI